MTETKSGCRKFTCYASVYIFIIVVRVAICPDIQIESLHCVFTLTMERKKPFEGIENMAKKSSFLTDEKRQVFPVNDHL